MGTGAFANSKGKRGEREAVKALQPTIDKVYESYGMEPPKLFRNQNQSADGGYDIAGLEWMALEIKRCETLSIPKWWRQCTSQGSSDQVPILMYRQNSKKWNIIMYGYMEVCKGARIKARIQVDLPTFLIYMESKIRASIHEKEGVN